MKELASFQNQIKHNCNISDSQYWGYLSLCNMLLRLRELYFHEHGMRPWDKVEKGAVGDWITGREKLWETLEEEKLNTLDLAGKEHDPFALEEINKSLDSEGLIYGAGYGILKKPNFFLGRLQKKEKLADLDVYYVHQETCRDLTPHVAMHQNGSIYIRMDIYENYLYQKFMELKKEFHADTLNRGFEYYGMRANEVPGNLSVAFNAMARELVPILLWHEQGEASEAPVEQDLWLDMLKNADNKLTEIRLRAVKDVLADNCESGTLKNIIENREKGMLYFHLSLIDESRKYAFGEVHNELGNFEKNEDWPLLDAMRIKLNQRALQIRNQALELYRQSKDIKPVAAYMQQVFS